MNVLAAFVFVLDYVFRRSVLSCSSVVGCVFRWFLTSLLERHKFIMSEETVWGMRLWAPTVWQPDWMRALRCLSKVGLLSAPAGESRARRSSFGVMFRPR
jgi:hypothetical protein